MVSVLQAAIRMAWVMSLVSVPGLTVSGLCSASGICAGIALAAALAASRSRRGGGPGGARTRGAGVRVRGAGLCRAAILSCGAVWALVRVFLAALAVAAAVFFAGFGTSRAGSSGVVA